MKRELEKENKFLGIILEKMSQRQCDQFWGKFATLAKFQKSLAKFLTVYFLFGKVLSLLWQKLVHYWANFNCC